MEKIILRYIGGAIGEPGSGQVFGGTMATNYAIKRAFEGSELFDLQMKTRADFNNIKEAKDFLDGGDISWLDDTSFLEKFYDMGYKRPDMLGPITRSPVKRYNGGNWTALYTPEYFYNGAVIRLNESEEKSSTLKVGIEGDFTKHVSYIRHGIDLDMMKPKNNLKRKYILWAGQMHRPAKNYEMWVTIQEMINKEFGGLPKEYEFKTMSGYNVDDYWDVLEETAVLVNTSLYESFCCAVAEARAKGAAALVKENFNGEIMHLDQPGQTYYTALDYARTIMQLTKDINEMRQLQNKSYEYVNANCGLDAMREDIEKVLLEIMENK